MSNIYDVTVIDRRVIRYSVEASSAEEAQEILEGSDDADNKFGFKTIDSEWGVESVEKRRRTIRLESSLLAGESSYEVALIVDPDDPEAFEILWADEEDGDEPSSFRGRAGRFEGGCFIGVATDKENSDEEYRVHAYAGYLPDTISGEDLVDLVRGYFVDRKVSTTVNQRDFYNPETRRFASTGPIASADRFKKEERELLDGGWELDGESDKIVYEFDILELFEEMVKP